jgi:hypothetical protein
MQMSAAASATSALQSFAAGRSLLLCSPVLVLLLLSFSFAPIKRHAAAAFVAMQRLCCSCYLYCPQSLLTAVLPLAVYC